MDLVMVGWHIRESASFPKAPGTRPTAIGPLKHREFLLKHSNPRHHLPFPLQMQETLSVYDMIAPRVRGPQRHVFF